MKTDSETPAMLSHSLLIVDSCPELRQALAAQARHFGATDVETASNERDALVAIQSREHFDGILCSADLGQKDDGLRLLHRLRRGGLLDKTTFILMCSQREVDHVRRLLIHIPDALLLKPFSAQRLLDELSAPLSQRTSRQHAVWQANGVEIALPPAPTNASTAAVAARISMPEKSPMAAKRSRAPLEPRPAPGEFLVKARLALESKVWQRVTQHLDAARTQFPMNLSVDIACQFSRAAEMGRYGHAQAAEELVWRLVHRLESIGTVSSGGVELVQFGQLVCQQLGFPDPEKRLIQLHRALSSNNRAGNRAAGGFQRRPLS